MELKDVAMPAYRLEWSRNGSYWMPMDTGEMIFTDADEVEWARAMLEVTYRRAKEEPTIEVRVVSVNLFTDRNKADSWERELIRQNVLARAKRHFNEEERRIAGIPEFESGEGKQ